MKYIDPLVSIVVPCYNQASYINETLQSVIDQTYTNWECIIVDDGSTDRVEDVLLIWIENDSRFKVLRQKNQGVSIARNNGIKIAKGEIILTLDSDDLISSDYIKLAVDVFEKKPSVSVVYSNALKFGEVNKEWNLPQFSLKELAINNIIFNAGFFRKRDWVKVGGFDNKIKGMEDWEFWIAILKDGGDVYKIDKICFHYRIRSTSRNHSLNKKKINEIQKYITKKHIDFYIEHYGPYPSFAKNIEDLKLSFEVKLNSEKFIINLFTKKFLGFFLFKNLK